MGFVLMGGIFLAVLFVLIGTLSIVHSKPLPVEHELKEQQQIRYLEQKIGECDARGGVANLHPLSGYLGCDLPILRTKR
jgi:hypothetical protein